MHRFIFLILILSFLSCENATESKIREIATFKDVVIEGSHSFEIPPISTLGLQRIIANIDCDIVIDYPIVFEEPDSGMLEDPGLRDTMILSNQFVLQDKAARYNSGFAGVVTFDTVDTTRHVTVTMDREYYYRVYQKNYLHLYLWIGSVINQSMYLKSATVIAEY